MTARFVPALLSAKAAWSESIDRNGYATHREICDDDCVKDDKAPL
jgi:hypothetical protein